MPAAYSATEIVDVAKQIERCGEAFYVAARKAARHPVVQMVFTTLERDEAAHARIFEDLLTRLLQADPTQGGSDQNWRRDEDYVAYMRGLAESRVFPTPEAAARAAAALSDERSALHLALRFERDSILFLEGMRRAVRESDRPIIDELVAEESRHVAVLTEALQRLVT